MTTRNSQPLRLALAGFLVAGLAGPVWAGDVPATGRRSVDSSGATSESDSSTTTDLPYKYVGNTFSLKFHRPSCVFARAMSAGRVELFHFRRQAVEAGMQPCRYCLPPDWKTVRAVVVGKPAPPGDALPPPIQEPAE